MMTEHEHAVVDLMEREGGGFVQALAVCFRKADAHNFQKLRVAFWEYWHKYEKQLEGVTK